MRIKEKILKSGKKSYEVYGLTNGRGSKRLRRIFRLKSEAEAFISEFKSRRLLAKRSFKQDVPDFEETRFHELADYWLRTRAVDGRMSRGQQKKVRGVLSELLPRYGKFTMNYFTPALITEIQNEQISVGHKPATINRKIEVINAILNYGVRQRKIPFNPASGFEKLRVPENARIVWTIEEAIRFLEFADCKYPTTSENRWIYVVYLLALNTALRAGEIWGLKVRDLIENGELLLIDRQWERTSKSYQPTKGRRGRRVPCNSTLREELKRIIEANHLSNEDHFFRNQCGNPIDHDNFKNRIFEVDVKESESPPMRFHDLRHCAITLMIGENHDPRTVQGIAGHQDIKTTMGYSHLVASNIKKVAQTFVIAPAFSKQPKPAAAHLRLVVTND